MVGICYRPAMRAAVVRKYGPPDVVEFADIDPPSTGPGQVQIRVHAASLNPLDVKLRAGDVWPFLRLRFPAVLGFDVAGEIEAVGQGVTGWSPGDRIYGRTDAKTGGTHAEFAVVAAAVVDRIPARLSFLEAASLPLTAMTAIQALDQVHVGAGERLLVNGAAGGVGAMAVQVGRARGASVIGVASGGGAAVVSRLGARVLDYTTSDLARATERVDVILDTVAARPSRDLARLLADRGRYISTVFSPGLAVRSILGRFWSRQRFGFVVSRADGQLMRQLSALVEAGHLTPVLDSTFPLSRIADAHRRMESGHVHGKIVVTIP
jgi:NADPH:quinone reductase-like Zn-dependent oxidoreductase